MSRTFIKHIESYLPQNLVSNHDVAGYAERGGYNLKGEMLSALVGECNRYYADADQQASDLAVNAARKILDKIPNENIDLLIFASACGDLIEPATANIVQHKLGLTCPAFDIKNACNSIATAIEVGSCMMIGKGYNNVLIVSGEKPSDSIRFTDLTRNNITNHIAAFTFGDAGVALLLEKTTDQDQGIFYQRSKTFGQYWDLCRVLGGGSMFPRDASKLVFSGNTYELKKVIDKIAPPFVLGCLEEAKMSIKDIDFICSHQVSKATAPGINEHLKIGLNKIIQTFPLYGNTASTSMPLALEYAMKQNQIQKGNIVMLLGMAAGINLSVQLMKV
ncbi:MAG TPA: ketoacyl-ACP synthase III [Chryseolinea sp.]|nr:ketoacyl-ACP synthase III [Chryseolinea sp.]HPM30226.1 ketoacyl-ACP synthase III [Chryseolinea sp.]